MAEYIAEDKKIPNGKNLAMPMVDVTSDQQYTPEKKKLPNGKYLAMPVIVVAGDPVGPGAEVTKEYVDSQDALKQDKLVAGENITIDPDTNTISSTASGTGGTDVKLSTDPLKTKWDGTNKNLVLSNTDDTNITIPMDTLIDYVEYSNNNNLLNDAIDLKSDLTYVNTNFTNLGSALTEKADKVDVYTKTEVDVLIDVNDIRYDIENNLNGMNGTNFRIYNTDGTYRSNPMASLVAPYQKKLVAGNGITIDDSTNVITTNSGLARVRYTLPNLASNTSGTNIFASAEIIDFEERVEIEKVGTGVATLYNLPKSKDAVQYSAEVNFKGTISSSTDADDLVRFELWNGTNPAPLKSRSITRSQLNDSVFPSGGVDIPFFTRGLDDPMTLTDAEGNPTGGFKILVYNRTGATINTPQLDVRIKRL
jgi:hypothetical protein